MKEDIAKILRDPGVVGYELTCDECGDVLYSGNEIDVEKVDTTISTLYINVYSHMDVTNHQSYSLDVDNPVKEIEQMITVNNDSE